MADRDSYDPISDDPEQKSYGEQMRTEIDSKHYRAGRLNAIDDWKYVNKTAEEDRRNDHYIEALGDAVVSRMNWIMKTGFQDAYRLGYVIELSELYSLAIKEITH